ncbi:bactofilin family protein [Sphingobium sp. CR28]|uniref:bactofilin family protein n=1 Tax=Sphingobium sp. CR28 TaxID=3400272 RepID=UPI003FEE18AD
MFSKSSKSRSGGTPSVATGGKRSHFSIIGSDVAIRGDIKASVDLHVDGRVEGNVQCAALVQGPESRIIGQVEAKSARIAGVVEGGIVAHDLVVEAGARIVGDVSYETITIAPGGQIDGRFSPMTDPAVQAGELKLVSDAG